MKSKLHYLGIVKLKTVPTDLKNIEWLVDNEFKKCHTDYNRLVLYRLPDVSALVTRCYWISY